MKKLKTTKSLSLGISVSIIMFALLPALTLLGASDSATVTVSWTIKPFQSLSIAGNPSNSKSVVSTYNVPDPTNADLNRGFIEEENALTLLVVSNVDWEIHVKSLSNNMGTSFDGTYTKPLEDFELRAGNGNYQPLTKSDQVLASGEHGKHKIGVDYKVNFHKNEYKDGNYQVKLLYTITTK